jgi:hypothetical protein
VISTKIASIKTDWRGGARNVQIKLPTSLVRIGDWLCGIKRGKLSKKIDLSYESPIIVLNELVLGIHLMGF